MISRLTLVDTGPLVAALNRSDRNHDWAKRQLVTVRPPLVTCESVLSEACFLVRHLPGGRSAVLELVEQGLIEVRFNLQNEAGPVKSLLRKYRNVPMALADACLVRMAELMPETEILTLDSDFQIYRKHRSQPLRLRFPGQGESTI